MHNELQYERMPVDPTRFDLAVNLTEILGLSLPTHSSLASTSQLSALGRKRTFGTADAKLIRASETEHQGLSLALN
jgi:hypothetical protein